MKAVVVLLLCWIPFTTASLFSQSNLIPEIHQRVTDLSGTLSDHQREALERKLETFEHETSNQVAVLLVPSLEGESLEDFALAVAEKNKFGKKGRDNGILLTIAKEDHELRFDVGYGLEGVLPDATCDQIIRHVIIPQFRRGDYYGGIDAGIDAVMLATKGEFKGTKDNNGQGIPFGVLVFIIFIVVGIIPGLFRRRRYYINSGGWRSSGMWYGGFGGGGFGGSGFGGGGFGGGGFSGGGGSFGGGGASGSW